MVELLLHGDCFDFLPHLPPDSVDLILCDPPYGTTVNKWDSVLPLGLMWGLINRVSKPDSAAVIHCAQPFTSTLVQSNLKNFKYCWVWDKKLITNFLNSKKQPLRRTEDIAVFYKKQPTYNPQMTKGKAYGCVRKSASSNYGTQVTTKTVSNGDRFPDGIIKISQVREKGGHPTQKPVALMEYLINTYTNPGGLVLDFTMGSGSTGVAAKNLGRGFIGIEKDEKYFKIAQSRMSGAGVK